MAWVLEAHHCLRCAPGFQVEGVTHGDGGSTMQCGSGVELRSAAALDATGHALKLVEFDTKFDPGYQVGKHFQPLGHKCTASAVQN